MKFTLLILSIVVGAAVLSAQEPGVPTLDPAVQIVTYLDLLPKQAESGRSLLSKEVLDQGRRPGCRAAKLWQEQGRANHFILVETWLDSATLESWRASSEYMKFRIALQPALGSPLDERRAHQLEP